MDSVDYKLTSHYCLPLHRDSYINPIVNRFLVDPRMVYSDLEIKIRNYQVFAYYYAR